MDIHRRFDSLEEYTKFFMELIGWVRQPDKSLWRSEDYPKLEPYFKWQSNARLSYPPMTDEIKTSFDFYLACHEAYGKRNAELRDSVKMFDEYHLADAFAFSVQEDAFEAEDDEGESTYIDAVYVFDGSLTFPIIVTGVVESGWDRLGKSGFLCIRFVEAKEFD